MLNSRSIICCCFLFVSLFFSKFCSLKWRLTWFWIKWIFAVILFYPFIGWVVCAAVLFAWLLGFVACGVWGHCLPAGSATSCAVQEPQHQGLPVLSWHLCCCCHTFYSYMCSKRHSALFLLLFKHLGKMLCTISMPLLPCCRLVYPFFFLFGLTDLLFLFF